MNAIAQSLPAVAQSSGIDWFLLLGIAAIVGAFALFVWYKRKNPTAAAAAGTAVDAEAKALLAAWKVAFADWQTKTAVAATPAPVAAEPAAPAVVAGKNGVAGTFTATVTGDPKVDLPALTAAYLG